MDNLLHRYETKYKALEMENEKWQCNNGAEHATDTLSGHTHDSCSFKMYNYNIAG